ncbi:unnamed protein product [Dracunculus medinensis]|uniref:IPT/TIG domain-containing protein n=1 Tax=Dracunculus medinensis TaxID=318479 RepID=A0A0N4U8E9_DRAME|nr:unnamed protein product [Dracunculus medinensis]
MSEAQSSKRHIKALTFFKKVRPCHVVFGIYGQFFRTTAIVNYQPEWNEIQSFVVPSDLVSFYISIRDDTSRIAEIQLPVSELEFDSERSSKVFLSHRKNKECQPFVLYRCAITEWRKFCHFRSIDWLNERIPLIVENFKNTQIVEWKWFSSINRYTVDFSSKHNNNNNSSKEIILPTRNPCHTDPIDFSNVGSCCVVNSVVPNHGSVLGGTRVMIAGSGFGMDAHDLRAVLIAGCDCTNKIISHSPNQIKLITRKFFPIEAPIIVVTKNHGTAISNFNFTFYDEKERIKPKRFSNHNRAKLKQYQNRIVQTSPDLRSFSSKEKSCGDNFLKQIEELKIENKRQKIYLDQLVSKIMLKCPELLSFSVEEAIV